MQTFPAPRISASELRPGRHWYVTATALAVVLTLVGVVIGVFGVKSVMHAVDTDRQFANGDTVTLRLEAGSEKTIWVKYPGAAPGPECAISGPGAPGLGDPGADLFLTWEDTWTPLYTVDVRQAGDYEVTCSSEALSRYAIGGSGGLFALGGRLVVAFLLPVFGIGGGVVIALVTAFRRRRHRRRLTVQSVDTLA